MDRKARRRAWMGMQTVLGWRPQGFFAPYRYADQVEAPTGYPELEPVFDAARPAMAAVLDDIDAAGDALAALDGPPPVPRWDQSWFPRLDGAAAFAIVRRAAPVRIVEVGSGHSTRMLCHAAGKGCEITCIDPQPRAVLEGLPVTWRRRVLGAADFDLFRALAPGDVAFFDSSNERSRVLGGIVLLAGYLWLLSYAGFLLASVLFYFVLHRTLAPDRLSLITALKTAMIAGTVTLILYALFHHVLLVPLPPGVWFS